MASIDDLFRKPNAAPKRKLEDPNVSFRQGHNKAAKLNNGASPHGNTNNDNRNGNYKTASVQDDEIVQNAQNGGDSGDDDDIEAGPSLPPEDGQDADEDDVNEDDEGRFFGSGVTKQERQVLDYIDRNEGGGGNDGEEAEEEKYDLAWLKRTAISFERKINKNAELRARYEDEPMKFVGSEADLDADIKGWSLLAGYPELYADFVRSGCVASLVGLLAHENTDITIAVCELLTELTDEDSGADEEQWKVLVDALMKADIVDLLVSNLERLEELNESDRSGVYHVLNVVENLLSESRNVDKFGSSNKFMTWLAKRIETQDVDARAKVGQNRQYAAEILAILLQDNERNRQRLADIGGVDTLLQLLSAYRKRDPEKDSDEAEFVENLFDCLVSVVKDVEGAQKFLDGEGVELCLIMLREGKLSKARSFRIFDHALGGTAGAVIGERLVEAAGLKHLFSAFMKARKGDREIIEHMIGIFASMLRYLPADSAARIRTLAKFVEKDYEKACRLVELRRDYASRVAAVDDQIKADRKRLSAADAEDMELEWLSRRLDAGLFSLQTLDVILAWLVAEDDGARKKITELLAAQGSNDLHILRTSLQEQISGIDDEGGADTKDMLETLIKCLG